jgi:nitroimidazol reductase NimA-like FMN-containing flavoprotein (pyridoxamine 5'-phosphate oxidase superfamily)
MAVREASSGRTRVKRIPERGAYDRTTAYAILDEAFICHVGFVQDGHPFVIPTGFGRDEDHLYIHGSAASRMLRTLDQGVPVCVTATLIDGLVLARSIFHHSINYRSVVVLGTAKAVTEREEKLHALRVVSEHMAAGRWDTVRQPSEQELKATMVLKLPIEEFSAKMRTGPPKDDEEDYSLPVWAGILPLNMVAGTPIADEKLEPKLSVPPEVAGYDRKVKK